MMSKRKFACVFLLLCALLLPYATFSAQANVIHSTGVLSPPSISAQSAVLLEVESGEIAFSKQADFPLPMASTTKIMTGLVALELAPCDTVITVSPEAVGAEGSSIYLSAGEKLTLEHLLYALLLESANDAALAIAIGLCGSVDAFAEKMNQKATELGLSSTHFVNPHGLDATEHYTTAYELARITQSALQNPKFSEIVSTRKTTIPHTDGSNSRLLVNHNKLLRLYDGCIGVKTGFTKKSGRCLVSAAQKDGVTLIAVTLNAPDDWNDHKHMLDYGFTRFSSVTLSKEDEFLTPLPLVGGTEDYVMVGTDAAYKKTLPADHAPIRHTVELPRFAYAGVQANDVLGQVRFFCDTDQNGTEEEIAVIPLYAKYSVGRYAPKQSIWNRILDFFKGLLGIEDT